MAHRAVTDLQGGDCWRLRSIQIAARALSQGAPTSSATPPAVSASARGRRRLRLMFRVPSRWRVRVQKRVYRTPWSRSGSTPSMGCRRFVGRGCGACRGSAVGWWAFRLFGMMKTARSAVTDLHGSVRPWPVTALQAGRGGQRSAAGNGSEELKQPVCAVTDLRSAWKA